MKGFGVCVSIVIMPFIGGIYGNLFTFFQLFNNLSRFNEIIDCIAFLCAFNAVIQCLILLRNNLAAHKLNFIFPERVGYFNIFKLNML